VSEPAPPASEPARPPATEPVELVIESSTRGARATFRGETYRLPLRAELARGDRPELVEVTVPGHRARRAWITLDRDRKLTMEKPRGKRGARRTGDAVELTAAPDEPQPAQPEPAPTPTRPEPEIPTVDEPPPTATRTPLPSRQPAPGTMDRDATRRAVQRHLREIRMCFERGRMDNPQLSGRVLVRIDVAPSGKVTGARVARSDLRSQAVESCILSAVEGWTLPAPAGGVAATITYPFAYH
jgi:TonB family protein